MPQILKSLFAQVVIALVLGVVLGVYFPDFAKELKPLGDGFIKLIKMVIPAIVFCVVVTGICGAGDLKKVGRVGIKAVVYFEIMTTIALLLGIVVAYTFEPGVGMNIDPKSLDAKALSSYVDTAMQVSGGGVAEFFLKLIPSTVFSGFVTGDILQVLLVSVMFGCALALLGERGKPVVSFIESLSHGIFQMMFFIVKLAPLGVVPSLSPSAATAWAR
jgi:aerobic C4-dicarboxylate transport protein